MFIAQPAVEFNTLLATCNEAFDHSVTTGIDSTEKNLSTSEKFISILSYMRDPNASVGLIPNLLTHVSFSVLTVADDMDILDILEACSGMAFTYAPTKHRSILMAVITGTVQQWRDAVVTGTKHQQATIRSAFNQIHNLFVEAGLYAAWNDYVQKPQDDGTYKLIEYTP